MANTVRPHGLRPVRYRNNAPYQGQANQYLTATDSGAIYLGDVVSFNSTGNVTLFASGKLPLGVMVGREVDRDQFNRKHVPANTQAEVYICDDPNVVFEVQVTTGHSAITAAEVGKLGDLVLTTGDATTGHSRVTLAGASGLTTATAATSAQVRIFRVGVNPQDTASDANGEVWVTFAEHVHVGRLPAPFATA